MMREIKFRGKSDDEWIYGFLFKSRPEYIKVVNYEYTIQDINNIEDEYFITDSDSIGQFTGMEDKNGTEIYEGDIIYIKPEDIKGEVIWDENIHGFAIKVDDTILDLDNWEENDLIVEGNVHDNS